MFGKAKPGHILRDMSGVLGVVLQTMDNTAETKYAGPWFLVTRYSRLSARKDGNSPQPSSICAILSFWYSKTPDL